MPHSFSKPFCTEVQMAMFVCHVDKYYLSKGRGITLGESYNRTGLWQSVARTVFRCLSHFKVGLR